MRKTVKDSKGKTVTVMNEQGKKDVVVIDVADVSGVKLRNILRKKKKLAKALTEADLFLTSGGQLVSVSQEPPACRDYIVQRYSWNRLLTEPKPKKS